MSKSLGLKLFQHPDQLEILRSMEAPGWEVAYRGVAPGHFPGLEPGPRGSLKGEGGLALLSLLLYEVLCGQLTPASGSGIRLHSSW